MLQKKNKIFFSCATLFDPDKKKTWDKLCDTACFRLLESKKSKKYYYVFFLNLCAVAGNGHYPAVIGDGVKGWRRRGKPETVIVDFGHCVTFFAFCYIIRPHQF